MREIHAKRVNLTLFHQLIICIYAVFQPKIGMASAMLKMALNDVDSVDGHQ
jgi:hypothetical protein